MAHGTSQCSGDFSASQFLGYLGLLCVRYHLLQTCLIFPSFVLLALFTFSQFFSVALLKSFQKNSLNTSNDNDK